MVERTRTVQDIEVPSFLYGTAWKGEWTEPLVTEALSSGFRGIDTANQAKHYNEAGVGEALAKAVESGQLTRGEVFLQTKFTPVMGQDHRLPYDPNAAPGEQVRQSLQRSLEHLGVEQLDSFVLHGPTHPRALAPADREVWQTMEALQQEGRTRLIGVSNVTAHHLRELVELAQVPPAFVQNRCFAQLRWDAGARELCARHGIVYQGFSLLTANRQVLEDPQVQAIAERHGRTVAQVIFRFALQLDMIPLTGTTDSEHMRQDLQAYDFALSDDEVRLIEQAGS